MTSAVPPRAKLPKPMKDAGGGHEMSAPCGLCHAHLVTFRVTVTE